MKTLKTIIITIFLGVISQNNNVVAQEYLQLLDTLFITMETEANTIQTSYIKFNNELIATEDFRFNKAIQQAEKENNTLFNLAEEATIQVKKAHYIRVLRKAANINNTVVGFRTSLAQELPKISTIINDTAEIDELYDSSRSSIQLTIN